MDTKTGILVQVICNNCHETMPLESTSEQGSVFKCESCDATVTVRLKKGS
jgi:transcription initiation factor IIE alpha subunit